jgi:thymidylate synthase (FAD)
MITVLDHGYVKLVDSMGDDSKIVSAARTSYDKGTKTVRQDAALIDYLLRNFHTSPFEMVEFTFEMQLPMFVARQMIRHRTASVNEVSARYSELEDTYYVPALDRLCTQSSDNKQGSSATVVDNPELLQNEIVKCSEEAFATYRQLLDAGLSRELARIVLPVNTYTKWVWKCDLNNLMKFLVLRSDPHAQYEIRVYAEAILELIRPIVPATIEAFEKHMLNGVRLSEQEISILRDLAKYANSFDGALVEAGFSKTQISEFLRKLKLD